MRRDSIWDKIVFKKIQNLIGGRVKMIVSGSAPISGTVKQFVQVVFGCQVRNDTTSFIFSSIDLLSPSFPLPFLLRLPLSPLSPSLSSLPFPLSPPLSLLPSPPLHRSTRDTDRQKALLVSLSRFHSILISVMLGQSCHVAA